ncbi:MAG: DNA polymerase I [Acidimicrobiia bacterium]
MSKILLLDGHSLAYRAFFALPTDLATASGTVTNAVYGFTSMLIKVLADEEPDRIVAAFDTPKPTFRNEMDEEYKAQRESAPDLFAEQLPLVREVLDTLCIPVLEVEGVEADDVIATLAESSAAAGDDVIIVTGDRDSYQLVSDPHVRVLYNRRGVSDYVLYDEAGIEERTGVPPGRYVDYAAMRGDKSDNLPGVPGIGEKTAAKLIARFDDLEGIYEHLDDLPPKQRENLGENRDRVFKNREMMTLRRDVDLAGEDVLSDDVATLAEAWDLDVVRELFEQLEFRSLWNRLVEFTGVEVDDDIPTLELETEIVRDVATAREHLDGFRAGDGRVVVDAHWNGLPGRGAPAGFAFLSDDAASASDDSTPRVVYIGADALTGVSADALDALLGDDTPRLVVHGAKTLMHGLRGPLRALDRDTEVMAYLLDPAADTYGLEDLALRHLGVEVRSPDAEEGTLDLDAGAAIEATARRAAAALQLGDVLAEALDRADLTDLYTDVERPLVSVLAAMEECGVRIDVDFLDELRGELADQIAELEASIHAHAGGAFNIKSTPQLRTVLFEDLGLTPVKRTKTGPSTDADSLGKLVDEHPIVADLLRFRELEKLRSTYADALPPLVADDGRIHATFDQTATTTGRISSVHPNLQNIPVRSEDGREMRRAFIADEGCGLLTADYSQIELRVLAHLAEDPGLIDAFARGADVHTTTAATVFDVPEEKVDDFQRRFAKVVNYGLAYGMEAYGLAQRLDIPTDQAAEILDSYFEGFPNVAEFMETTVEDARTKGYTTTILGRRRKLPELSSGNFRIRQMGERMAQNAPVQGSAADIFKLAMIDVDTALRASDLGTRMILTVHDELVFETPDEERDQVEELVRDAMSSAYELEVPLVVDTGYGRNWAEAKA